MSDTSADKDSTIHINYDEVLRSITTGIIASAISPFGLPVAIYQALKVLQRSKPTPTENLREIIKEGKEQGVAELEVDINKSIAGQVALGGLIGIEGVNINIEVKHSNRTIIKVKYK